MKHRSFIAIASAMAFSASELLNALGASMVDAVATGTILNDD